MKLTKTLTLLMLLPLLALGGCSKDKGGENPIVDTGRFDGGMLTYSGMIGSYENGFYALMLYKGEFTSFEEIPTYPFEALALILSSDYVENFAEAQPADGVYTTAESFEKYSIVMKGESAYISIDEDNTMHQSTYEGSMKLSKKGAVYTIEFDFTLEGGEKIKGAYVGALPSKYDPSSTKDMNLTDLGDAYYMFRPDPFSGKPDLKQLSILLTTEGTDMGAKAGTVVSIIVNVDGETATIPTGTFQVAAEPRKGVAGTAEPYSVYAAEDIVITNDKYLMESISFGCGYGKTSENNEGDIVLDDFYPAKSGGGHVKISAGSGDQYTIEFSFENIFGSKVTGSYTGAVDKLNL